MAPVTLLCDHVDGVIAVGDAVASNLSNSIIFENYKTQHKHSLILPSPPTT
jgi:hypothetical protein